MRTGSTWTRAACDAIAAVLLAPSCAACRLPLEHPTAGAVCPSCWRIPPLPSPFCDACADPLLSWRGSRDGGRCPRCRSGRTAVSRTRAAGAYDGSLRAIVHALKFDGRRSLASGLSAIMRTRGADLFEDADVAVPVPLHPFRHAVRGFNQAAELARPLPLRSLRALRRIRYTSPQADLPAGQRHSHIRGAFQVRRSIDVAGACIVLIDDVSTTGATLEACARALLDGGAREVRALIAARAVSRAP
jgi:ComF family protein